MTLWQTILVIVYMAGLWSCFKQGLERNSDVKSKLIMGHPVHPMTMSFHKLFYANMAQIIVTAVLWPITLVIGIGLLLYNLRKFKREYAARRGQRK